MKNMATLRRAIHDLGQPVTYLVEMTRVKGGLISVSAKRCHDVSQTYKSVLRPDQLHEALSCWANLPFERADQVERDLATSGHVQPFEADLLDEDKTRLRFEMTPGLPHTLNNAPVEDEDLTEEMTAALDRSRASLARGKSISHDEILREFTGD